MTKKEWSLLKVGDRVKVQGSQLDETRTKLVSVTWFATVDRFNFGCSQVLIKYDTGTEVWKGRLGIELL
jgi:hypothetical protein